LTIFLNNTLAQYGPSVNRMNMRVLAHCIKKAFDPSPVACYFALVKRNLALLLSSALLLNCAAVGF
jgi:hypothetical protein